MVINYNHNKKTKIPTFSEREAALQRNRQRMKQIIQDYKEWSARILAENDDEERRYLSYEGMFLRNHFKDGWSLYKTVSKDYHSSTKVKNEQNNNKAA